MYKEIDDCYIIAKTFNPFGVLDKVHYRSERLKMKRKKIESRADDLVSHRRCNCRESKVK